MPRRAAPDPPLPVLFTAAAALGAGLTRDQIRQRVRSGRWVRAGRGCYRRADWAEGSGLDSFAVARVEHAHRAIAAVARNPGCTIAMHSAAVVHGLPLFGPLPETVALVAPGGHWTGRRPGLVVHGSALPPGHVDGGPIPVTSVPRTWWDIARTRSLADGLAVGDAAVRAGRLDRDALLVVLAETGTARGCRLARRAAIHVDGLRESVLESGSWAYFVEYRLPLPRMQVTLHGSAGRFIGRVDFLWEVQGVVGECDGRLKYASTDVAYREKRREDDIRDLGLRVVRWGWQDLWDDRLAHRLRGVLG